MNDKPGRCQCLESCPNLSLYGEAFCEKHIDFCPRRAPTSGAEPLYEPDRWNSNYKIRKTHNCFTYSFNIFDPKQIEKCKDENCHTLFHQPGSISGYPKFNDKDPKTCPNMISRLMGDNPSRIIPSAFELRCPRGTSKIALIVDPKNDYHFLRQNKPDPNDPQKIAYFSQKSGAMPVTDKDALGHKIFDVRLANHYFKHKDERNSLNYDMFCGYFCISRVKPLFLKTGGGRYALTRRK